MPNCFSKFSNSIKSKRPFNFFQKSAFFLIIPEIFYRHFKSDSSTGRCDQRNFVKSRKESKSSQEVERIRRSNQSKPN
jgi:hypothetical protein